MQRPVALVVVSFVALTIGFVAGQWFSGDDADDGLSAGGTVQQPIVEDPAQALIQAGMQALANGNFVAAESHFRSASAMRPDEPAPHADLAVALMYQERWEEARAELETAREIAPELAEAYFLEGIVERDGYGNTDAAREAWERFLVLVPEDTPQADTVRGWIAGLSAAGADGEGATVDEILDQATGSPAQ